jgi:ribonuclease HI
VYDAEVVGAYRGLLQALDFHGAELADNLFICLDNLEVAGNLLGKTTTSSQQVFEDFAVAAQRWATRTRRPFTVPGRVAIRWVPGHAEVLGNEEADREAKAAAGEAALLPALPAAGASVAHTKRRAKESMQRAFALAWPATAPKRYIDLGVPLSGSSKDLLLSRFTLGKLYASRTGHGDFAEYHRRFDHQDTIIEYACGRPKSPDHFFYCKLGRRATRRRWYPLTLPEVLSTTHGARCLNRWLEETGYFRSLCSPYSRPA